MQPFLKWSFAAAGLALSLSVLLPAAIWLRSEAVIERRYPLLSATLTASTDAKSRRRGAHLAAIGGCADCHGSDLEGRHMVRDGILPMWSPNLRRLAHAIADDDFERAVRSGIAPDSRSTWLMPAMDYTYMSEDDLAAILAYLRSLDARGPARAATTFDMRARFAVADGDLEPIAVRALESPASLDLGPRYDGGRYLARIACGDCHGTDLQGSKMGSDLDSVAPYSRTQFFALLRGGRTYDGRALGAMARPRFRALYDYEIDALYDYLSARAKALSRSNPR
ncbi:MAG TPA: cytochrome c [Rhizomicrobium sp.]|nr:cytochrome c [Rhizomicrobium sp.]